MAMGSARTLCRESNGLYHFTGSRLASTCISYTPCVNTIGSTTWHTLLKVEAHDITKAFTATVTNGELAGVVHRQTACSNSSIMGI